MTKTQRLVIHGTVQGVGFRYSMVRAAQRLGITGWVRNRRDGAVEAIVQGPPQALADIITWAKRGPPNALVTRVDARDCDDETSYATFTQAPTA